MSDNWKTLRSELPADVIARLNAAREVRIAKQLEAGRRAHPLFPPPPTREQLIEQDRDTMIEFANLRLTDEGHPLSEDELSDLKLLDPMAVAELCVTLTMGGLKNERDQLKPFLEKLVAASATDKKPSDP